MYIAILHKVDGMRTVESITAIGVDRKVNQLETELVQELSTKKRIASKESLLETLNTDVHSYIRQHIIIENNSTELISSCHNDGLLQIEKNSVRSIVNVRQINDVRFINKYLIKVNETLPDAGIYIGCVETTSNIKEKLFDGRYGLLKTIVWVYFFFVHRVWPKVPKLRNIYFFLTKGKYRWLTNAEVLGRLVSCGFEIIEYKEINGKVYFVVMKTHEPDRNMKPSFAPIFGMPRIGKNGEYIKVYKIRTMHPYSEYLQDYVIRLNGYNEVGKPANDFRLTSWGQIFRKYWLDEIPQIINVLKGNMAIVGMRPLSKIRFNELPEDVRQMRIKFKPGCIPPYVALNMPDKDSNIEAERIYMSEKMVHPFMTDVKYFFMAIYNILTGKIRSA